MRYFLILITTIILFSCSNDEFIDIDNMVWAKNKTYKISTNIKDKTNFKPHLLVRVIPDYPYQYLPLVIKLTDPSNNVFIDTINVEILDSLGNFKGEALGDYGDIDTIIFKDYQFKEFGIYNYELINNMNTDIPFIMQIGIGYKK